MRILSHKRTYDLRCLHFCLIAFAKVIVEYKNTKSMSYLFNIFTTIGMTLANVIKQKCKQSQSPGNPPPGVNSTFKFQEIQITSVLKNLSKLKTNKSTGLDRITTRLLKDAAVVITPSLTQIFNLSLSSSTFP